MLIDGEVDAVISARAPHAFGSNKMVTRLFPNYRAEEARCFRETGIFPIMHLMTMRRSVFDQYPWIAVNLLKMFEEAKRRCLNLISDFTCARLPLPWSAAMVDEIISEFGPDPYPYGIEANRVTIEAFCRFAHDQGVTDKRMKVDDLFAPQTAALAKV